MRSQPPASSDLHPTDIIPEIHSTPASNHVPHTQKDLNQLLLDDIQPFLGCTDISIIVLGAALASAAAQRLVPPWVDWKQGSDPQSFREIQPDEIVSISLQVNEGLFKTSHTTAIPNANGYRGHINAAALGIFCNPYGKLNLLSDVHPGRIGKMNDVVAAGKVHIEVLHKPCHNLFLRCKLKLANPSQPEASPVFAESCLQNSYTRVILLKRNQTDLFKISARLPAEKGSNQIVDIPSLLSALEHLSPHVLERLEETLAMNTRAYEYGLEAAPGLGIGAAFARMIQKGSMSDDLANLAACQTAAAEDVRMAGENLPVMGIVNSGSHGINASIPIMTAAQKLRKDRSLLLKSIALSFRITQKIDMMIGSLSTPCGCVIKAGIGAAAGITYYMGGSHQQIEQAINNFITSTAGVICDGAKTTCSLKLANSASNACKSALLAIKGITFSNDTGGVVRNNLQQNLENMIQISKGMQDVDPVIVKILKNY